MRMFRPRSTHGISDPVKARMRSLSQFAALALAALAFPASAAIVSETRITVTGGSINGQTFTFTAAYGDWFVLPNDAHASFTLSSGSGPGVNQLSIEWDGKGEAHSIIPNDPKNTFSLRLGQPVNQSIRLDRADAIEVSVIKMDDLNLEARISGTATGAAQFRISGVVKLHRDAANYPVTGTYMNCDPVVHDKFAGAQNRSPSECEVKFDSHVRESLAQAFAPVVTVFSDGDWAQTRKANMGPIDSLSRKTEKSPFRFDASSLAGSFRLEFRVRPESAQAQRSQATLEAFSKKMAEAMKSPAAAVAFQTELAEATRAIEGSSVIAITVGVNAESIGIANFRGSFTDAKLPVGAYLVTVPYAQAHTGGDITASHETTWAFLGPWSSATATKSGEGQSIKVKSALKPGAPTLSIQNIYMEIQANAELAKKIVALVDWKAMQQLIDGK